MDNLQKKICHNPANLEKRMSKIVLNIRDSYKLLESQEKLESGISSWRKNLSRS